MVSFRHSMAPKLAAVVGFSVLCLSHTAFATPGWIRLSFVHDPSTTMTVAWNTATNAQTHVRWGTSPSDLSQSATGTSAQVNTTLGYVHEAEMTGLQPGTRYYYQVGDDTDGWSAVFTFVTGPQPDENCSKFRFVYLGDNRPDKTVGLGDNWKSIFAEATGEDPLFVMDGGDLVYTGEDSGQWVDFLDWTGPPAAYVPFMPTMGNHDDDSVSGDAALYNKLFALPRSTGPGSSGTEDYYFFEVGNAIFVSINTQLFTSNNTFSDQAKWLDDVLTKHPKRWKFVMMHHPIYTGNFLLAHKSNEKGQNPALVAVIDKHHVDMVLQSHNHWYEHFAPSNCSLAGNPGSTKPCPVGATNFASGTVYLTSGGAGALTIPGCDSGMEGMVKCDTKHHYVIFDIDDNHLHMETWRSSQQTIGNSPSNHVKIDQLDIVKPATSCGSEPDAGVPDSGPPDAAPPTDSGPEEAAADGQSPTDAAEEDAPSTYPSDAASTQDAISSTDAANDDAGPVASPAADTGNESGCSCSHAGKPSPTRWGILAGFLAGGLWTFLRARRRANQRRRAAKASTGA